MTHRGRFVPVASVVIAMLFSGVAFARTRPNYDALSEAKPKVVPSQMRESALLRPGASTSFEERLGVPTFVWPAPAHSMSGMPIKSFRSSTQSVAATDGAKLIESAARAHLAVYSPLYQLSLPELDTARLTSVHNTGFGPVIARFHQEINGIEVFRDTLNVAMDQQGQLVALSGYITGSASGASLSAESSFTLNSRGAADRAVADLCECATGNELLVEPARVKQVYFHLPDHYEPAYYVEVEMAAEDGSPDSDYYSYVISANDGQILFRNNLTADDAYSYRVWADTTGPRIPYDGPQGSAGTPHPTGIPDNFNPPNVSQNLLSLASGPISTLDPWLPPGSTFLTGNNAEAYSDVAAPDGFSFGDTRGTASSPGFFDYLYDANFPLTPNSIQASLAQLFYNVNFMHDWYYDFGFNEVAGNAQFSNYGRGGMERDRMRAEAQDSSGRNNANMSTPSDGGRPRMQMYIFDQVGPRGVSTVTPAVATYNNGTATFGVQLFDVGAPPNPKPIVRALPNDGCLALTNAAAINGNIAFIDRGTCNFDVKVKNAQNAGAVGVVIANVAGSATPTVAPGLGASTPPVTGIIIGTLSVNLADGDTIRAQLGSGPVTGRIYRTNLTDLDGTIDNQIVAHEWAHYLSNRLIGDANGLINSQGRGMGEGWSDFNALVMTVKEGDNLLGTNANYNGIYGLAGYATHGTNYDGSPNSSYYFGIRRVPYSTDMTKDPLTFKHTTNGNAITGPAPVAFGFDGTNNAEVHNTGEVWATMLWECYASLLRDTLGASPRLTFQQAQDRMKSYLVASLKLTPSAPTILEARDAVLAAAKAGDTVDYAEFVAAFAKRGAGAHAVAADRWNTTNGTTATVIESFTGGVGTGDANVTATTLTDDVQSCDGDGSLDNTESGTLRVTIKNVGTTTLAAASATVTTTNATVTFLAGVNIMNFPPIAPLASATASVKVTMTGAIGVQSIPFTIQVSDPSMATVTASAAFTGNADVGPATFDNVETTAIVWTSGGTPALSPVDGWRRQELSPTDHNWFVPDAGRISDQWLMSPPLQVGPAGNFTFTFRHRFAFEASTVAFDGGVVEVSNDNGATWTDVVAPGRTISPAYNGTIALGGGNPLEGRAAYVGATGSQPVTLVSTVNLGTAFDGQTVRIRFRMGADVSTGSKGWEIDDITFTNLVNAPFPTFVEDLGHPGFCASGTSTTVTTSSSTIDVGQSVTFTATISPQLGPVGGNVTWYDGNSIRAVTGVGIGAPPNQAKFTTSSLSVGGHMIRAHYDGDAVNQGSDSQQLLQVVRGATTASVTSNQNPTGVGNTVTFTATINPVAPATGIVDGGSVTFFDGPAALGNTPVFNGTTQYTINFTTTGPHDITAQYNGGVSYAASAVSAAFTETVELASTTTLATSPNPSVFGAAVTLTATVTDGATGTVTFRNGTGVIGSAPLNALSPNQASIIVSNLAVGTRQLTATYEGDATFGPSTSDIVGQVVNKATPILTLTSSLNPSYVGNSVTFTVTFDTTLPTGSVTFRDGATNLGPGTIVSGVATFTTTALTFGTHSITAVYAGNTSFNGATSNAVSQQVDRIPTTTTLGSSPNPSTYGLSVTFTATVTANIGTGTPTGNVAFFEGATLLGTAGLTGGQATLAISTLAAGDHSVIAKYGASATYDISTSDIVIQHVEKATSTPTLTSSLNPSNVTQSVTFTATLSGGATGDVSFFDGATLIGTGTLNGLNPSVATFSTSSLAFGPHPILATYPGDSNFNGATSNTVDQVVNRLTATLTLTSSLNPSIFGNEVTFTATASPTAATGDVTFFDGADTLGTVALSSGVATFATSTLTVGSHTITATYDGDTIYGPATSNTVTQDVNRIATTTTLDATPATTTYGDLVTLTATVSSADATGDVEFFDGTTSLGSRPLSGGTATLTTTTLTGGSHSLTASYPGDATHFGSTSAAASVTVNRAAVGISVATSGSPSNVGTSVTFTATVDNVAATGTVTFYDGADSIGTAPLSGGTAAVSTSTLTLGSHSITAVYGGDTNFTDATSSAITQEVVKFATVTTVSTSPNPSVFGGSVTFTATVDRVSATGGVTFYDGATAIGAGTLNGSTPNQALFATPALTGGSHSITAVYGGDGDNAMSTSAAITHVVNKANVGVTLTSSLNPSHVGDSVTFTATLANAVATGTVAFFDGTTLLDTIAVSAGAAAYTTPSLAFGSHDISAVYSGDGNFNGATSNTVSQVVNRFATTTTLSSTPNPSSYSEVVTFTATVDAAAATGTVTFYDGATMLGTGTLNGLTPNQATFTTSALSVASHSVTATYGGDAAYDTSTSAAVDQVVTVAATTTTLTSSLNPSNPGDSVTFTATVDKALATGLVTFKDGPTTLGTGTLNGLSPNQATFTTSSLLLGAHSITAEYPGDGNFAASTSNTVSQTVNGTLAAPGHFTATATSTTSISLSWDAVLYAHHYEVYSREPNGTLTLIGSPTTPGLPGLVVASDTSYLYLVRAVSGTVFSDYSRDFATTIFFDHDPLTTTTLITADDANKIRFAVDKLRAAVGLAAAVYTNVIAINTPIRALDVNETRTALAEARTAFSLGTAFTNTVTSGGVVRAADYQEMRSQVKGR